MQVTVPRITTATQTATNMPYSKSPIIRASNTCERKAIAALKTRMTKTANATRRDTASSSVPVRMLSATSSHGINLPARVSGSLLPIMSVRLMCNLDSAGY